MLTRTLATLTLLLALNGGTDPTPPAMSAGMRSSNGSRLPATARVRSTWSGARQSITDVSTYPAWASPAGTAQGTQPTS